MPPAAVLPLVSTFLEQHFTIGHLAELWGWDVDTVRPWFDGVPGLQVVAHPEKMNKRSYTSIRVPASIAEKIYLLHATK